MSVSRASVFESVMGSPEVFVDRAPTCLACQPRSGLRIWDNQDRHWMDIGIGHWMDNRTLDGVTLDGHWMKISICKFWTLGHCKANRGRIIRIKISSGLHSYETRKYLTGSLPPLPFLSLNILLSFLRIVKRSSQVHLLPAGQPDEAAERVDQQVHCVEGKRSPRRDRDLFL